MEKNNYSHDKFNNRYNENYSPLVSSRNKNKSYEIKDYNEYNPNSVRQTNKYSSYLNNHLSKDGCRKIIYIKKQNIHLKLKQDNESKNKTKSNKMKYIIPFKQYFMKCSLQNKHRLRQEASSLLPPWKRP